MLKIFGIFVLSLVFGLHFSFAGTGFSLAQRWELEKQGQITHYDNIPKDRHVLFVAGLGNEITLLLHNYFHDNHKSVDRLGLSSSFFGPSSKIDVPTNAETLYSVILQIHQKVKVPLIVVGHSKGGAEVLFCILEHPDLILNGIVDRVVLMEAAIGGSPLLNGPASCAMKFIMDLFHSNLDTLMPDNAHRNFDQAFADYERYFNSYRWNTPVQNLMALISSRIFYVRSAANAEELGSAIHLVLDVVKKHLIYDPSNDGFTPILYPSQPSTYSGLNDGLLPVESQIDTRIGVDLGILHSDHIGLTVSGLSKISKHDRHAFTRALLGQIYD
jgi:pimeloyl-ACP methyl ester carboxylesterase